MFPMMTCYDMFTAGFTDSLCNGTKCLYLMTINLLSINKGGYSADKLKPYVRYTKIYFIYS